MSLGIAFKGPEGIVLAADSRVTITAQMNQQGQNLVIPATFDNATKLLKVGGQNYVGAVTYGLGSIGLQSPRTAHSYISEFEAVLMKKSSGKQMSVENFAIALGDFFLDQWKRNMPSPAPAGLPDMLFLVGGYDEAAPYGRVFELSVPNNPKPKEWFAGTGEFGAVWGGQREFVDRLVKGFDERVINLVRDELKLSGPDVQKLTEKLNTLTMPIPFQFLPLQDCVDLSIFLIRATIKLQTWTVGIRGVGGAVDVATITKTVGFTPIQQKQVTGEKPGV
jgi:hypothetical protein